MGFYLFQSVTLALFSSLYPDFCIALLGIAPRILSGRPLSNYNKAMSHEEAEPHNMGFYLFIRGTLDTLALFSSQGKLGKRYPKSLYTPISA